MKKTIKSLKSIAWLGLILVISISCDSDFTNIESDIQGIKNFEATSKLFPFTARTENYTPFTASGSSDNVGIQTSNLNGNLFGIHTSPTNGFGTTIASVTAQVAPVTFNPDFGNSNRSVESVFLNIPYFASIESTDEDGNNTYKLDSLIGNANQEFKLSIYRNNFLLRDLDPNTDFQDPQCYYSNQGDLLETNAELLYTDEAFRINADEYPVTQIVDGETETERFPPGIRINLLDSGPTTVTDAENANTTFWQDLFFANQDNDVLGTRSNFKDFFRGLIIKVESLPGDPINSITYLNFNAANVIFDYTNQEEIDAEETFTGINETVYRLEFNDNIVNTFDQINFENNNGDEDNLYLKGTEGSMAILELFSGNIENEEGTLVPSLNFFTSKKDKWLINEANLVFYVNQNLVEGDGSNEPNRVTLYDLKNNVPIIDYFLDGSTNTNQPTFSKIAFSEVLERDDNNKGVKYKMRLTSHITNILQNDSTNVRLGLFIANNVNNLTLSKIQGKNNDDDDSTLDIVPSTSVLSPKGTILHGYDDNINTPLRAEFEIFYTEPKN